MISRHRLRAYGVPLGLLSIPTSVLVFAPSTAFADTKGDTPATNQQIQTKSVQSTSTPLSIQGVSVDNALTQKWRNFGDTGGGWLNDHGWAAADGTYSVSLPNGEVAWLFNDTFLGPVNQDESLASGWGFIHNSLVLATHGSRRLLTTVTGGTHAEPQSLATPTDTSDWYWNTDGIVDGNSLYVFEAKIGQTDAPPPFNFGQIGMDIAKLSLSNFQVERITPTYSQDNISWGTQLLRVGPWIYIYGTEGVSMNKYMHLARVRAGNLLGTWQFYTGTGWSSDPNASARLLGGVGSSYGVTEVNGQYVLTTTDSNLGSEIYVYTAPAPTGPFTQLGGVYNAPEAGGNIYIYNVAAHPEISAPNQLVISYNVNSFDGNDILDNVNNNRARFITLHFTPEKQPNRHVKNQETP